MCSLSDQIQQLQQPDANEIEITTIGAGGFEGESIIIHFGNNQWGIVDSCVSQNGIILPLFYLEKLGVGYDKVAVVVCTHWHTDHIRGLSEVVKVCENAKFYFPMVGQRNNLLRFIIKGYEAQGRSRVWKEFMGCLNEAGTRAGYSYPDKVVFDNQHGTQLVTLSPSDKMLDILQRILLNFDIENGDFSKISESMLPPNICSTAIVLNTPDIHVLLGGDLESNRNRNYDIHSCTGICGQRGEKGWCNVITASNVLYNDSISLFKLPHHSSETSYCQAIWDSRTANEVTSVSTIFVNNAGVKLPQQDLLRTYFDNSSEMFLTSSGPKKKEKKSLGKSKLDQNKSSDFNSIAVFSEEIGFVCSRRRVGQEWATRTLGTALKVTRSFVNQYKA